MFLSDVFIAERCAEEYRREILRQAEIDRLLRAQNSARLQQGLDWLRVKIEALLSLRQPRILGDNHERFAC